MNDKEQFETMVVLRAYAQKIINTDPSDIRPSTAHEFRKTICMMMEIQKKIGLRIMTHPRVSPDTGGIKCAVCGKPCRWVGAESDSKPPFGGWYCQPCDTYTETDVEVED